MKKTFLFVIFLFSATAMFSITDAVSSGTTVFGKISFELSTVSKSDYINGSVYGKYNHRLFDTVAGIYFSKNSFQCMANVHYFPLNFSKVSLGLNGLYHYGRYFKLFHEHDLYFGPSIVVKPVPYLSLFLDCSFAPKFTIIDNLKKYIPYIVDKELALKLGIRGLIGSRWKLEGSISSYEDFSYSLFFLPSFNFSCINYASNGVVFGINTVVRYTDMFTLTSYFAGFELQMLVGYKF